VQQQQQQWPLAWRFFCRKPLAPFTWSLPRGAQQSQFNLNSMPGSVANPAAPPALSHDLRQAADATAPLAAPNAHTQDTCPQQQQQQASSSADPRAAGAGSWRQQAASTVRGRLKAWAGRLLSKCAVLLLGALQVSRGSNIGSKQIRASMLGGRPVCMLSLQLRVALARITAKDVAATNACSLRATGRCFYFAPGIAHVD
jgi:hypothetical protein